MAQIFIDGYNFLWASGEHRPEAIDDFQQARDHLIARLAGHPRLARHQVTVVFDAYKTDATSSSIDMIGGIRVQFSRGGETADDVLKEAAREHRDAAIVVSSDREVARFAEKQGCGVLGSHEFDRVLLEEINLEEDDEEALYERPAKKGPSRRDPKARRKALARLR